MFSKKSLCIKFSGHVKFIENALQAFAFDPRSL